ncbi:MAG: OmpH family outer membrane protein [Pyrinomonadaceae bacterium]
MKRISLAAACLTFAAIFAGSAMAQAGAAPAGTGKIGIVVVEEFAAEKGGITKYKAALTALDKEFEPVNTKLRTAATRYQTLGAEIETLRKPANPALPQQQPNQAQLQAKVDEAQNLEKQIKRDQEDAKAQYERRSAVVVGPIYSDIMKALNEYAKKNGYAVIFDGVKLDQAQILLGFDEKYNITADFITFYNARPAAAATATRTTP